MPPFTYHFKIHSCEKDRHHHIITSETDISPPFWTFFGAMRTIEEIGRDMFLVTPNIHHLFLADEIREIKNEIWNLTHVFRENGFSQLQSRELTVGGAWKAFQDGETGCARYPSRLSDTPKKKDMLPFICDFVNRPAEELQYRMPASGFSRRTLRNMASERAWPKSAKELKLEIFRAELKEKEKVA